MSFGRSTETKERPRRPFWDPMENTPMTGFEKFEHFHETKLLKFSGPIETLENLLMAHYSFEKRVLMISEFLARIVAPSF